MVLNKRVIQKAIFILLIIKINKLIGMIHGLVDIFFMILNKSVFFIDYYRSLMTKRLDIPCAMTSQSEEDLLSNKLMEILKERHELQLRTQELERMVR